MAEYIEREAAIRVASGYCHPANIAKELSKLPAADVRPVVLCKDCKCYRQSNFVDKHMVCVRNGFTVHSNEFCSFGEKMEES